MEEWKLIITLFLLISILTLTFWILFGRWVERNKEHIPGRLFEFLFFLFLFFATYYLTIAISYGGVLRVSLMSSFIISAVFAGYLHYIKKIYN